MCGIFGFTGPPDPERLALLREALRHRGPDGEGELVRPALSMGCDRLAIVGRGNGAQPLASEDGRIQLVCNGEIYNHRALRRELERRGHRFATESDAEVVVHAFEDEGEAALGRLQGMFALALWDEAGGRLLLARDPAGMKSLFYLRHQDRWWFASEAKALLLASGVERRLDLHGARRPAAAGVRARPAHPVRRGGPPARRPPADDRALGRGCGSRPSPRPARVRRSRPAAIRGRAPVAGSARRSTAIWRRRCRSAPRSPAASIRASWSGLMAERLGAGVKTFAIGCPGDQDERPFARRVAERFRTDHREIAVGADDLWRRLPRVIWQAEEPRGGPLVPNSLLFERAAEDVRVLLLGEGADELFGGYLRFKTALPPLGFLPARLGRRPLRHAQAGRRARPLRSGPARRAGRRRTRSPPGSGRPCASAERGGSPACSTSSAASSSPTPICRASTCSRWRTRWRSACRFSMPAWSSSASGCRWPPRWAWRDEKMILREAARGLLPDGRSSGRRKQGQANPLRLWEAAGLLDRAADLLAAPAVRARGLFQPRSVDRLLARLRRGRGLPFDRNRLHFLVLIEIWHRVFLDPERLAPPA